MNKNRRRRWLAAGSLGVALAGLLGPVALVHPASATPSASCSVTWGSLAKTVNPTGAVPTHVTDLRSGRHTCYDRVVWDLAAGSPTVEVEYVKQVVADGSGQPVALRGGAYLHVVLQGTEPPSWSRNRNELVPTTGYQTLRQVAWANAFEGYDSYGVGVRARLPYRVFVLQGPGTGSRVVLDIAHHW